MIYVSESQKLTTIQPIQESTFAALGVWERAHMEEWIRQAPQMLGEELLIVSTELDSFEGSKDRLALREFALGVEGLERFATRREPLRRVHECVFGVLALESEPVDPRL